MRRAAILTLLLVKCTFADVKTGELDLSFTARSPLSSAKVLTERLAVRSAGDDDDLAGTHFLCYVPRDAETAGPMGLIVWLNYRAADVLPKSIEPLLDRTHTIFIIAKTANQDPWARAGLALDATFNLKQQYTIDDRRTYLFALLQPDDTLGQQMGLAFPDAFAGFVYILNFRYFRPINAGGVTYAASFGKPANGTIAGQSKLRRHVLLGDFRLTETNHLVQKAYWQDGFTETALIEGSSSSVTYPKLDAELFGKVLEALALPPATSQPATRAAAPVASVAADDEPARLINLSQNLIVAGQNEAARAKLRDILARFPENPAAGKARQMLSDLDK